MLLLRLQAVADAELVWDSEDAMVLWRKVFPTQVRSPHSRHVQGVAATATRSYTCVTDESRCAVR